MAATSAPALRCIARDRSGPVPPFDLLARIEQWAQAAPDALAVVHGAERTSVARLAAASRALARDLAGSTAPALFVGPVDARHVAAMLACLGAGRPFVPVAPDLSPLRLAQVLLTSGADVAIRADDAAAGGGGFPPRIRTIAFDRLDGDGASATAAAAPPDRVAFIVFTSGSTGVAKGVPLTVGALASTFAVAGRELDVRPGDRVMLVTPAGVATGPGYSLLPLHAGARLLLASDRLDAAAVLGSMARERATHLLCYVGLARALADHPAAAHGFAALRALQVYGDVVTDGDCTALRRALPDGARLHLLYASTESFLTAGWEAPVGPAGGDGRIPLGRPTTGVEMWLRPVEDDAPASEGELLVAGPRVTPGYWRDAAATQARTARHPEDPGRMLLSTGDVVRLRTDGLLELRGRIDNQVKLRGWRIELEEIETAARRLPGVAAAAVVARRDELGVVAALSLHVAGEVAAETVADGLRAALPSYMVPARIAIGAELPVTGTGKVDRVRLAEIDRQQQEAEGAVSPRDDGWPDARSSRIAAIIAEEAGRAAFSPGDRATDIGLDSLHAVTVALRIEKQFAVSIEPDLLLSDRTMASIVAEIAAAPVAR